MHTGQLQSVRELFNSVNEILSGFSIDRESLAGDALAKLGNSCRVHACAYHAYIYGGAGSVVHACADT